MPSNQIASRFVTPNEQSLADVYDKLNYLLSKVPQPTPAVTPVAPITPATPTTTTLTSGNPASTTTSQYAIVPILNVLPSNNPTQGAPYAVAGTLIEVAGQLYIYVGSPTFQWQLAGALVPESTIVNAEWLTVSGTANAIIGTTKTIITALAAGMVFRLVPTANNTLATTLNVDGTGVTAVTKNSSTALVGGELQSGREYLIGYDGTQFQIIGASFPISALVLASDSTGAPSAAALASANIWIGSAGGLPVAQTISGDATLAAGGALTLATVNASPGTYTNATVTVNAKGLSTTITSGTGGGPPTGVAGGGLAGTYPNPTVALIADAVIAPVLIAALPGSPSVGGVASVSNALAPVIGHAVAGTGTAFAAVMWNGSQWTVFSV